ncbi:MAG: 4-alpha-glucanotransferase [Myxococcota bacterium]
MASETESRAGSFRRRHGTPRSSGPPRRRSIAPRRARATPSRQSDAVLATSHRRAGLLLHPTCLPNDFPIGDLGPAAHELLDWTTACGLSVWQVLPLGPTGFADSPYGAQSSFAGNPLLISPEALVAYGLLAKGDIEAPKVDDPGRTAFQKAKEFKQRLHRRVWGQLSASPDSSLSLQWKSFASDPSVRPWLDDWVLFAALKEKFDGRSWLDWEADLRDRKRGALESARRELAFEVEFHAFEQYLFFRQWAALRAAAEARGIELVGDLPFYPALDSADVWSHRRLFLLGRDGRPLKVAGVPPDYFSATGQLWGNPLYRWEAHAPGVFAWWAERVRWQLRLVHRLRLDHFRGFVAYWEVPAGAKTAAPGRWHQGPGQAFFDALAAALGSSTRRLPLLAEDLGEIDEPVHRLRRRLGLAGMRVLQFGFSEDDSLHAPHRHPPDSVVYTGTHDNDTSRGWISSAPEEVKRRALAYLGATEDGFAPAMVRAALTSPAALAVVPLQDLLGLGTEARMNTPARESGNWTWRVKREQVSEDLPARLRALVLAASRTPPAPPPPVATPASNG